MQLTTLGRAQVAAGRTRVGPDAPVAFPLLLHLALERDRAVPRVQLQELIFPEQTARNASHSLRQSVYKLRTQGFPIEGSGSSMHIAAASVRDDYTSLLTPQLEGTRDLTALMGGWLPGFDPSVSPAYSHWFEGKRAEIAGRIRSSLLSELILHKRHGRWQALEQTSRAVLMLDPLNEEATLGLAEALALSGSKVEAVRILDRYQEEVPTAELRLSASVLKRRISERTPERPPERKQPIFVGREKEMEALTDALGVALSGVPTGVIVHGEPGIGKTRLLQEASGWAAINGFRIATHTCRPHDVKRPLGVFTGLLPQLRTFPGALGSAPAALKLLARLEGVPSWASTSDLEWAHADNLSAMMCAAIEDLLEAVLVETPVLIAVDDSHSADDASLAFLARITHHAEGRLSVVLGGRAVPETLKGEIGASFPALALKPLPSDAAQKLLSSECVHAMGQASWQPDWAQSVAGGNPLFLVTLARQASETGPGKALPTKLAHLLEERIRSLTTSDAHVFASICVLGRNATHLAIERLLGLARHELLAAICRLEEGGFVAAKGDRLESAHPLFVEHCLQRMGPASRRYLYHAAANVLNQERDPAKYTPVLWDIVHLKRLSGASEEAATLARACAANALSIGHASDACDILLEAYADALVSTTRDAVTHDLLRAARACGRWQIVKQCAKDLRQTPANLTPEDNAEVECAEIEAAWHTSHDHLGLSKSLLQAAQNESLAAASRLRAAELLVVCAVNLNDPSMAAPVRRVADLHLARGSNDPHCLGLLLIYEASFGDLARAEQHAIALLSSLAQLPPSQQTLRLRTNAAIGLRFAGRTELAAEILDAVHKDAIRLRFRTQAYQSAHELSLGLLLSGDTRGARRWLDVTDQMLGDARPDVDAGEDAEIRFWLALESGDSGKALEHARMLLDLTLDRSPRLQGIAESMICWAGILRGALPKREDVDALVAKYRAFGGVLGSDLYTLCMCRLLEACGREREAQQLAHSYVSMRRERSPIAPGLAAFVNIRTLNL